MRLFVHGWPDSATLFASTVRALEKDFYCVAVTLPGFVPTSRAEDSDANNVYNKKDEKYARGIMIIM